MNILFVIPSLAGGGQEKAGMVLTNYLGQFHQVTVIALEENSPTDYNYKSPVIRIPIKRSDSIVGKVIVVAKRVIALRSIKRKIKPDVSIAFGPTAMLINGLSGSEQKFSSIRQSLLKLNLSKIYYKFLFSISGKIVPVNEGINEELLKLYGIRNNLFVHNGYDLKKINSDALEPVESAFESFFKFPVISHLARFDVPKCNWQLVKVYHLAKQKMPDLKMLLIGEIDTSASINTSIYNFCIKYLQQKGYKASTPDNKTDAANCDVLLLGHQMNPHKYLKRSDVFVFPSAWEGFPNALVEAMACGLPVISANCKTGPEEILKNKQTGQEFGILMPVFDHHFNSSDESVSDLHQQWADRISDLLLNDEKRKHYQQQSLLRAQDFSVEKVCKKWLDIIENKL